MPHMSRHMKEQHHRKRYAEDILILNQGAASTTPTPLGNQGGANAADGLGPLPLAAYLQPVALQPGVRGPEVDNLQTSPEEIFHAVRCGFAAAYDLLAPLDGTTPDGWRVATEVFSDRVLDEVLQKGQGGKRKSGGDSGGSTRGEIGVPLSPEAAATALAEEMAKVAAAETATAEATAREAEAEVRIREANAATARWEVERAAVAAKVAERNEAETAAKAAEKAAAKAVKGEEKAAAKVEKVMEKAAKAAEKAAAKAVKGEEKAAAKVEKAAKAATKQATKAAAEQAKAASKAVTVKTPRAVEAIDDQIRSHQEAIAVIEEAIRQLEVKRRLAR